MTREIIFLGTGTATPTQSTSAAIHISDDETNLLIDVSGGGEITRQLLAAKLTPDKVTNIFITHSDNDHILGIVSLVRLFTKDNIKRNIYCSQFVKNAIDSIFKYIATAYMEKAKLNLTFHIIEHDSKTKIGKWSLTFFELESKKVPELGVKIQLPDQKTIVHCGDEPLIEKNYKYAQNTDVLIQEAFCLESQEKQFKAREKHHGTVKDAAENAQKLNAKTLALFHMEDKTLKTRKKEYAKEAKQYFKGKIFVPIDLDKLEF